MSRPLDWSPLAGSDPVPGDPDLVRELARRYGRTASAISTAAANLRKISGGKVGWTGKAGPELRERAGDVAETVGKAHDRYSDASTALSHYATSLELAQDKADAALRDAKSAENDARAARAAANGVDDPTGAGASDLAKHQAAEHTANTALSNARTKLGEATDARDRAGKKAADALHNAAKKQHDSMWDKIAKVLDAIANVAGIIATICGVLSLLVGWVPVIGQALAAILGTIALIASAIALVCHLALLIGGKGDLGDVIMDIISVASFGIGRAFSGAAKLSSIAARSKAWTATADLLRSSRPALNSAARRALVTTLMGGPRAGASPSVEALASRGIVRGVGGLRSAYGGLGHEAVEAGRDVWRGRGAIPGVGGRSPIDVASRVANAVKTQFGRAYQAGGISAVVDKIYASSDLAGEMARLSRISASVRSLPGVGPAIMQATVQNNIRRLAMFTGSAADGKSALDTIRDQLHHAPDVTGTPAPVGAR